MPNIESYKRFKRFRSLFEPVLGVIGLLFVSICVILCFFYLDYRDTTKTLQFSGESERLVTSSKMINEFSEGRRRIEFLNEMGNGCDVFDGDWVQDETYPLYQSKDCRFMDDGFRCLENGRKDSLFTQWRWQPKDCNLPRFDAKLMLEKLRNKRVAFVGDSIGRNQWESLLCMLSSAIPDKDSIYELNGSSISKHKGYLVFRFKEFNCTVEYYRAPFLVQQSRPPKGSPANVRTTLKLDKMDWDSVKWREVDLLVFNAGRWWNYEKTIRGGCYFQVDNKVDMKMKVESAYKRSIKTVMNWIQKEVNTTKTQVFFRTYSPVHFRGGNWNNGGHCHLETIPDLNSSLVPPETWTQFRIVTDVISAFQNASWHAPKMNLLNITSMASRRNDGHPSIYYSGPNMEPAPFHRQDCSHWCLPGVPDAWNELLYAFFLKREVDFSSNSSQSKLFSG